MRLNKTTKSVKEETRALKKMYILLSYKIKSKLPTVIWQRKFILFARQRLVLKLLIYFLWHAIRNTLFKKKKKLNCIHRTSENCKFIYFFLLSTVEMPHDETTFLFPLQHTPLHSEKKNLNGFTKCESMCLFFLDNRPA